MLHNLRHFKDRLFHLIRLNSIVAWAPTLSLSNLRNFVKGEPYQTGATLAEFVLIIPLLLTFIFSTLELGIMLAILVNLQSMVMAGAYYGATGAFTTGSSPTASAEAVMNSHISSLLNTANLTITIQSYPTFSAASLGTGASSGSGSPWQVGMYQAQYSYTPSSPLVAAIFGNPRILTATTYAKNEGTFPS